MMLLYLLTRARLGNKKLVDWIPETELQISGGVSKRVARKWHQK